MLRKLSFILGWGMNSCVNSTSPICTLGPGFLYMRGAGQGVVLNPHTEYQESQETQSAPPNVESKQPLSHLLYTSGTMKALL